MVPNLSACSDSGERMKKKWLLTYNRGAIAIYLLCTVGWGKKEKIDPKMWISFDGMLA